MPRKKRPPRTFKEWLSDDENRATVLRDAVRLGLLESFLGDDGRVRYRTTGKQVSDDEIERLIRCGDHS